MASPDLWHVDWDVDDNVRGLTTLRGPRIARDPYSDFNLAMHVGDDATRVGANRAMLQRELKLPDEPLWLEQVHGCNIIDAQDLGAKAGLKADGAISRDPSQVLAIMTADCLPVFLSTDDGSTRVLLHAGWRGLAEGIIAKGVAASGIAPSSLNCGLGPGISQGAFEVGPEVLEAMTWLHGYEDCFRESLRPGHYFADLYRLARQAVLQAEVKPPRIPDTCTSRHADKWFSFRRQGECGRMVSLLYSA